MPGIGIAPEIVWVGYIDPWAPSPPIMPQGTGVRVAVKEPPIDAEVPPKLLLAARVLQGGAVLASDIGSTDTFVSVIPPAPLAAGLPVLVQVEWIEGELPSWSEPQGIASAPVRSAIPRLLCASFPAGKAFVSWDNQASSEGASGGQVTIYSEGDESEGTETEKVAEFLAAGGSGDGGFSPEQGVSYRLYIRGVRPIAPNPQGGFEKPYTSGPYSAPLPVPASAPTIATASYDGETVEVAWSPVAAPKLPVPEIQYTLHLLADQQIVASFPAGPNGASAAVGSLADTGASAVA